MKLVVVESPAKAKTINKYLGRDYEVVASFGHVRDLPSKDGSVDPNNDFAMLWDMEPKAAKRVNDIAALAAKADEIILATDPDREGEAISWHLSEILRGKKGLKTAQFQRVAFNAITKEAVQEALAKPRAIDQALVDAYLARRALDYLVGFNISPVLWRKLPGARSAGRVQSVALRLVCDREHEIELFKAQEYWSVVAQLATPAGGAFDARVVGADGKKLGRLDILNEEQARSIESWLKGATYALTQIETKPQKRNPAAPFTTSTLQQEASRKLGMAPARTMQIAQKLYEGVDLGGETVGLITYMRTDGVDIAPAAVMQIRDVIAQKFEPAYLPKSPRMYKTKAKNAQEAHEAIRPTDPRRAPKDLARVLDKEMLALYELIWKRTLASQMEAAELARTTADIDARGAGHHVELRANGTVVTFAGFMALYDEDVDDSDDEDSRRLPPMKAGDDLKELGLTTTQHFTEPPPRYSEASLVKRMEELGIGRPSTYASTLAVLRERGYVKIEKKRLIPEDKGRLVTSFLSGFFTRYVEYNFTASLEEKLDLISNNEADWREVLREFWGQFRATCDGALEHKITEVLDALSEDLSSYIFPPRADGTNPRQCPTCGVGTLSLKVSKYGAFTGCSNYPECRYTRQLGSEGDAATAGDGGPKVLGQDASGQDITLRDGRFGPYVQLGEGKEAKRQSLPRGITPAQVDLERALQLINLPREVGLHPEDGQPIVAGLGRYGPYLLHNGVYGKLESAEDVFSVGLNRAVDIMATQREKAGARPAAKMIAGRSLGAHPEDGKAVQVKSGRYGPYVEHNRVFASLPKNADPEQITLEEALALLAKKAGTSKASSKKTTKSTPKKTATKKAPPSRKKAV